MAIRFRGNDRDDEDDDRGGGRDSGGSGGKGGFFGGLDLTKLMLQCQKKVTSILKNGKLSDSSVEKAIDTVADYAERIDAAIDGQPDTKAPTVHVEGYAAASGENKEIQAHTKVAIFEAGATAKLCIGTAESYAAADGTGADTYVNTFSKVSGVDTGSIHTYYKKGGNYEKALECLVAIDWESVYDREWVFKKHHSFYGRAKKELGPGTTVSASNDAYVEYKDGARVEQVVKVLAFDEVATVYAGETGTSN